jgi:hypothetical protein
MHGVWHVICAKSSKEHRGCRAIVFDQHQGSHDAGQSGKTETKYQPRMEDPADKVVDELGL